MAKKIKASAMIAALRQHVGDGYVYGTSGHTCTIEVLQAKERQYGRSMGNGYYHRNGDYSKGACARWLGKWVADCSGLIKATRRQLNGGWKDVSAQGTYDQCPVSARGVIGTMPRVPGCTVYIWDRARGRMGHVGMYVGNGQVVEARGVKYGVVTTKLAGRTWTHWGLLDYLELDLPKESGPAIPEPEKPEDDHGDGTNPKPDDLPVLRYRWPRIRNDKVGLLQRKLREWNPKALPRYGVDNDFGAETLDWVRRYQRANKDVYGKPLAVDGIVGVLTWGALLG